MLLTKRKKNSSLLLFVSISSQLILILLLQIHSLAQATFFTSSSTQMEREDSTQNLSNFIEQEAKKLSQPSNMINKNNELFFNDKRLFVVELLKLLHEQYAANSKKKVDLSQASSMKKEDRQQSMVGQANMMSQLLGAIGADGDVRRLIDWVQNSFNLASIGELTTQFVVSKLGSVNCAALLKPDPEETLIPRFLLFNDQFPDVPFELKINPNPNECLQQAHFDPMKKTIVLIHGYLTGYTLVDGLTNIKNRLLDLNKHASERFFTTANTNFTLFSGGFHPGENKAELNAMLRQQQYNVIIVDWFNGANPSPRSRYIRSAVNAQVVGQLIARFLSALIVQCRTPAHHVQIIAHSLGESTRV